MFELNVTCTDSCCCGITGEDICKVCRQKGHAVKDITVKQFVKKPLLSYTGFFFCENSECDVVYFNNVSNVYLQKSDIKERVGLKEKNSPRPICYCFGYFIEDVEKDGKRVVQEINKKIKELGCECEIKNPSGRCCLSDIRKIIGEVR